MRIYNKILLRALFITILASPIAVWAFYKPIRVLMPELNGVSCINYNICVEDLNKKEKAIYLYTNSLYFINTSIGKFDNNPKVIFCSTTSCFKSFGFHLPAKAKVIGSFGIVIGPEGWTELFLRHEMIHHLQVEKLGVLANWRAPKWLKEGMAYSLSEDSRELKEPWANYRKQFDHWYKEIDKNTLWDEAKKL